MCNQSGSRACSVFCVLCIVQCSVSCVLCIVQCVLCPVQCSVHCAVLCVLCIVYTVFPLTKSLPHRNDKITNFEFSTLSNGYYLSESLITTNGRGDGLGGIGSRDHVQVRWVDGCKQHFNKHALLSHWPQRFSFDSKAQYWALEYFTM